MESVILYSPMAGVEGPSCHIPANFDGKTATGEPRPFFQADKAIMSGTGGCVYIKTHPIIYNLNQQTVIIYQAQFHPNLRRLACRADISQHFGQGSPCMLGSGGW